MYQINLSCSKFADRVDVGVAVGMDFIADFDIRQLHRAKNGDAFRTNTLCLQNRLPIGMYGVGVVGRFVVGPRQPERSLDVRSVDRGDGDNKILKVLGSGEGLSDDSLRFRRCGLWFIGEIYPQPNATKDHNHGAHAQGETEVMMVWLNDGIHMGVVTKVYAKSQKNSRWLPLGPNCGIFYVLVNTQRKWKN